MFPRQLLHHPPCQGVEAEACRTSVPAMGKPVAGHEHRWLRGHPAQDHPGRFNGGCSELEGAAAERRPHPTADRGRHQRLKDVEPAIISARCWSARWTRARTPLLGAHYTPRAYAMASPTIMGTLRAEWANVQAALQWAEQGKEDKAVAEKAPDRLRTSACWTPPAAAAISYTSR